MSVSFLTEETLTVIMIHPSECGTELFHRARVISDVMDEMDKAGREYTAPVLTIDGFNDDPRELWHIPEARTLMKRACDAGFLSILHPCASSLLKSNLFLPAFGGFELWLCASDRFETDGNVAEIQVSDLRRFIYRVMPNEHRKLRQRIRRCNSDYGLKGGKR